MEKSIISKTTYSACSEEESSWTFYLEELLTDNNYDQEITDSDYQDTNNDITNNNLVSNAGAKKLYGDDYGFSWENNFKKSSFKKRKKEAFLDDSLEDTASSPVNSPKVGYFSHHSDTGMKEKHPKTISEEKSGFGSGDYTQLSKRGLCLVPVSTVANYFP